MITAPEMENGIAVVAFSQDSLDASNTKVFRDAIQPILESNNSVLLDLHALQFVDSSGLGALLSCLRAVNDKGGTLALCNMSKPVRTLFELVRMFRIYASRFEALTAMNAGTTPE